MSRTFIRHINRIYQYTVYILYIFSTLATSPCTNEDLCTNGLCYLDETTGEEACSCLAGYQLSTNNVTICEGKELLKGLSMAMTISIYEEGNGGCSSPSPPFL